MDDIPLPDDIPFPGDTVPDSDVMEEVCDIQLPDEITNTVNNEETQLIYVNPEEPENVNENCDTENRENLTTEIVVPAIDENEPVLKLNIENGQPPLPLDDAKLKETTVKPIENEFPMPQPESQPALTTPPPPKDPAPQEQPALPPEQPAPPPEQPALPVEQPALPAEPAPIVDPPLPKEDDIKENQTTGDGASLANNPIPYPANYMQYDPSMMSSSYSYMSTNNYASDYVSMYQSQRMAARSYANAYSYQNYNYPYSATAMQQMYDGRNMTAYATTGSYPQQMLPQNPPLPGQSYAPLPADYAAYVAGDMSKVDKKDNPTGEGDESYERVNKSIGPDGMSNDYLHSNDVNRYSPSVPMEEDETVHHHLHHAYYPMHQMLPMHAMHAMSAMNAMNVMQNNSNKTSSVLGKDKAKKRLMAFSNTKQAAAAQLAAKKQAQANSAQKKENGDIEGKSGEENAAAEATETTGGIFEDKQSKKKSAKKAKMEKARETIEEIEEIKRTEMMIRDNSMLYRQALMNDIEERERRERKRDRRRRSRSYSRSRSRRRTRSRSRDRKSKRDKKYRRRSRTKTPPSRTKSRSSSPVDKNPKQRASTLTNWNDFKEAGYQLDKYRRIKYRENKQYLVSEIELRKKEEIKKRYRRSRSRERRSVSIEKEVVERNRKKKSNLFEIETEIKQPVVYRRDPNHRDDFIEFPSHMMQYTNHRPVLKYCENPKNATLHFISRAQLLEIVPDDIGVLIKRFWNSIRSKRLKLKSDDPDSEANRTETPDANQKPLFVDWWPKSPLKEVQPEWIEDDIEEEEIEYCEQYESAENAQTKLPIESENVVLSTSSVVQESVAENPVPEPNEQTGVKVKTRKSRFEDLNSEEKSEVSVVVRSRWDSDYEDSPNRSSMTVESIESTTIGKHPTKFSESYEKDSRDSNDQAKRGAEESDKSNELEDDLAAERKPDVEKKYRKTETAPGKSKHHESKSSSKHTKSKAVSVERWMEDSEYESSRNRSAENSLTGNESSFGKSEESSVVEEVANNGDRKLASQYEEFLKMVSFEPPRDEVTPMYEGPKPPPKLSERPVEETGWKDDLVATEEKKRKFSTSSGNTSIKKDESREDERHVRKEEREENLEEVAEEEFDVDKFFMKEKKLRKLAEKNEESSLKRRREEDMLPEEDAEGEPKPKKKHDKKDKKKLAVIGSKIKKESKNKKKRKSDKKRKNDSSSESSSDSSDSDSEESATSDNSASSSSSSSGSSSSTSTNNESSSESAGKKKRKKWSSKKVKKKDKRKERKLADKRKKRKKKQKVKDSDSDVKKSKRKKAKNDDGKRKKTKRIDPENLLEFLEKSLTETLKKTDVSADVSGIAKKSAKEKRKKSKKKSDKGKKDKTRSLLNLIVQEDVKQQLKNSGALEDDELSDVAKSDKSSNGSRKKKKKSKKKQATNDSSDEGRNLKKKKINVKESKDASDETNETNKIAANPFFEGNLDDWNDNAAAVTTVEHSMRDDTKNFANEEKAKATVEKRKKKKPRKTDKLQKEKRSSKKKKKKESKKRKKGGLDVAVADPNDKADKKQRSSTTERNFAMFASEPKIPELEIETQASEKSKNYEFNFDFLTGTKNDDTSDKRDELVSEYSEDQSLTVEPERYSPTECDMEDESATFTDKFMADESTEKNASTVETTKDNDTFTTSAVSSAANGMFPCFASQNASLDAVYSSQISSDPSLIPVPVPPPSMNKPISSILPALQLLPTVTAPLSKPSVAAFDDKSKSEEVTAVGGNHGTDDQNSSSCDVLKNFGKSTFELVGGKLLSFGKLEVRTKAARKFVHSNIFDMVEEHANLEAPGTDTVEERVVNETKSVPVKEPSPPVAELPEPKISTAGVDGEKDDFQTRACIALPDVDAPPGSSDVNEKDEDKEEKQTVGEKVSPKRNDRPRSRSADRYKKKDRQEREDSPAYRRRSRSRSRSRSRDQHKKHHKDQHKKRSKDRRDRSRSRSRSRNRKRFRDSRYRKHDRKSTSRERKRRRRSSESLDRGVRHERDRERERSPPKPDENSANFYNILENIKTEKDDYRNEDGARYRRGDIGYGDSATKFNDSRSDEQGDKTTESSQRADMNALQEKLYQLKETLTTLNKQGVQMDGLQNVLSLLESNTVRSKEDGEGLNRSRETSPRTGGNGDSANADENSSAKFEKIMNLCHAIQNSLPSSSDKKLDENSVIKKWSFRDDGKSNASTPYKTRKSLADSTNSGFSSGSGSVVDNSSKGTFEERSREISPKPLSLDERLELELGVRRTPVSNNIPIPPVSHNLSTPPPNFYSMPSMYERIPNYNSSIPPPLAHNYARMMPPPGMDRNYYASTIASHHQHQPSRMDWNNAEAFIGHAVPKMPPTQQQPHLLHPQHPQHLQQQRMMMQPHQLPPPPQRIVQQNSDTSSYRVADAAGSKVHSIQVGNVLQIVPTELQIAPPSSQSVSSQTKAAQSQNVIVSSSSQVVNSLSGSSAPSGSAFSSILTASLPVSFAAAPAVSGSKSNLCAVKEQKGNANDLKQKVAFPTVGGSKITHLPLPPGTPDTEMKKLLRLAKEKGREEKVLQKLLKAKSGLQASPATSYSDENFNEDNTDGSEESLPPIVIKPSPEQGILISPGFKEKSTPVTPLGRSIIGSARKMVSFVDGVRPGAASLSDSPGCRMRKPSPPPNITKKKHKVRVKIVRREDSDDDDAPPPPPPGPPPPELYPPTCPVNMLPSNFTLPKL